MRPVHSIDAILITVRYPLHHNLDQSWSVLAGPTVLATFPTWGEASAYALAMERHENERLQPPKEGRPDPGEPPANRDQAV
jgi:hypothetical protein